MFRLPAFMISLMIEPAFSEMQTDEEMIRIINETFLDIFCPQYDLDSYHSLS